VDFLRGLAARTGRSGFGQNSMLKTWWGRALVASRTSRAAYAVLKCVCFCYLGLLLPLRHLPAALNDAWLGVSGAHWLLSTGQILTSVTVAFCLVRAIPVVWEGRRYLTDGKPGKAVAVAVTR